MLNIDMLVVTGERMSQNADNVFINVKFVGPVNRTKYVKANIDT